MQSFHGAVTCSGSLFLLILAVTAHAVKTGWCDWRV